jgi:hypothetical protein
MPTLKRKNANGQWEYIQTSGITYLTSISDKPTFIGQEALVNGIWYKSIATSSPSDWKQITN